MANETVRLVSTAKHPQVPKFGGAEFRVEDWVDRVMGKSWMDCRGNPACLVYAMRAGFQDLPLDDDVVYGKIGIFAHLVHVSEIKVEQEVVWSHPDKWASDTTKGEQR